MGDGDLQDLDVRRNRYKLLILYFRMVLKEWYNFYKAYNTGEKLSPPGFVSVSYTHLTLPTIYSV